MEKQKLKITLKVLHKVSVYFQETKQFIEEHLEKKFVKENMSVEEVIYFLFTSKPRSKELAQEMFFIV